MSQRAADALADIGHDAIPVLIKALDNADGYLLQLAAWALQVINTPEALKALEEYQQKSS